MFGARAHSALLVKRLCLQLSALASSRGFCSPLPVKRRTYALFMVLSVAFSVKAQIRIAEAVRNPEDGMKWRNKVPHLSDCLLCKFNDVV